MLFFEATNGQIDSNNVLKSSLKPFLCNFVINGTIEVATPPQYPIKQGISFWYILCCPRFNAFAVSLSLAISLFSGSRISLQTNTRTQSLSL